MDLDVLLSHEEGRHALARLIAQGTRLGPLTLRYIGLFRPAKRALTMSRTLKLLEEVWGDMERQAVTRKGRDWVAPQEIWQQAFEMVLSARDRGALSLPLTSHGYLYEVIVGLAEKLEAQGERQIEHDRRHRPAAPVAVAPAMPSPQPDQGTEEPVRRPAPPEIADRLARFRIGVKVNGVL
jgi:hypothetical protein